MTPAEEIRALVRERMRDVRIATGETTDEAETYQAKHARQETQP